MINKKLIITGALALTLVAGSSVLLGGNITASANTNLEKTPHVKQAKKVSNENNESDIYDNKTEDELKELGKKAQEEELKKQGITKKISELTDEEKKQIITNMINSAEEEVKKKHDIENIKKEYNYLEAELKDGSFISTSVNEEQFFVDYDS